MKLFGSKRSGSRLAKNRNFVQKAADIDTAVQTVQQPVKRRNPLKPLAAVLGCLLLVEILYFFAVHTNNSFISYWRNAYIVTAMETQSHQWLATSFIPPDIIEEVMNQKGAAISQQIGLQSSWDQEETPPDDEEPVQVETIITTPEQSTPATSDPEQSEPETDSGEQAFYQLFYEIDEASMSAYLEDHPEALDNGWEQLYINEAGIEDDGTSIQTIHGEQVLAIDVPNQILLIRAEGNGYIGVLAVAKDPARLTLRPSSQLGETGETAGTIAKNNGGVLAMTGSGFIDENGVGTGGILAGYAMHDGVSTETAHMGWGYKRLELHEDNLMYIKDVSDPVSEDTTDAVEFQPALIIDGKMVVDSTTIWNSVQPRACIGQSNRHEILMLVIEGRLPLRSLGTHVIECAEILKRHGAMQAMNLDGGTSAIMWYNGEYITQCSNQALPYGRNLPNAFVYLVNE